jgi:hypothetical protein
MTAWSENWDNDLVRPFMGQPLFRDEKFREFSGDLGYLDV